MSQVTKPILLDETGQAIVGKLQSIAEAIGIDAVRFTEQVLTEVQKAQARQNIDAPSTDDIPDISGLATKTELATKQDTISDLSTIRAGAGLGATALQPSALNPYRTAANQDNIDNALDGRIGGIEGIIPSQASESNELADKAFVNSTVGTNTAIFRGTFNSVAELEAYSGDKTNNDYAFVIGTDSAGNTSYNRYKYNGTTWMFEYSLNNSSFTATQWAAIDSGLSSSDKTALDNVLAVIAAYGTRITTIEGKEAIWNGKEDALTFFTSTEINDMFDDIINK